MSTKTITFIAAICCLSTFAGARSLTIGNGAFSSTIEFSNHSFVSCSISAEGEEITSAQTLPLFEFCVNGQLYTSADKVWTYTGKKSESLCNGGTVVTFNFKGRGALKGLRLAWDREYFPQDAFVRERMRLRCTNGKLALTNVEDKNHFIFPRYTFDSAEEVQGKELRIGKFLRARENPCNHMFHPDSLFFTVSAEPFRAKGPFVILKNGSHKFVSSYEHASQDDCAFQELIRKGIRKGLVEEDVVLGKVNLLEDDGLWFIVTSAAKENGRLVLENDIVRGGYLNGEPLPSKEWYETVWSTLSVLPSDGDENKAIGDYLYNKITENKKSREVDFYYNTWGLQNVVPRSERYEVMNYSRMREEILYAHECGVTTFVFDDGWHETFGHWVDNPTRFPDGIKPLISLLDSLGMRAGVWLSLPGAGPQTERTKEHPEWIVLDREGNPIKGQWQNPVYDIVSDYYDCLLSDLKALCDEGFRFFKWDAINSSCSTLSGLRHGDDRYTEMERLDRYHYLMPFYVTKLMRELREYCPDTVVEIDLTEPVANMIGLQILQEGKYYFLNGPVPTGQGNCRFRTNAMRRTINEYGDFMPQEIFTYAVVPDDSAEKNLMEYNMATAATAGHGIWWDLSLLSSEERQKCAELMRPAKLVWPYLAGNLVEHEGKIGDSPEIYVQRNQETGYALLTAFTAEPVERDFTIKLDTDKVLGVLKHAYKIGQEGVSLHISMGPDKDYDSAFVIGGASNAKVLESDGKLSSVEIKDNCLFVTAETESNITVLVGGKQESATLQAGETRNWKL